MDGLDAVADEAGVARRLRLLIRARRLAAVWDYALAVGALDFKRAAFWQASMDRLDSALYPDWHGCCNKQGGGL